jgi:hypothetical protein
MIAKIRAVLTGASPVPRALWFVRPPFPLRCRTGKRRDPNSPHARKKALFLTLRLRARRLRRVILAGSCRGMPRRTGFHKRSLMITND